MKTRCIFLFLIVLFYLMHGSEVMSQVSVNTDGSEPDPSAMLDIKSESQGMLLPRIDFSNRPEYPAVGLMIYVISNGPLGDGLYMYELTGWSKINTTPASYEVGAHIGGGVIFYIDPTGQHGLISSETDQSGWHEYGCNTILVGAGGTAIGTGEANTAAIVDNCTEFNIAAEVCDVSTDGGYGDWFLPSSGELDLMYDERAVIGGFGTRWFWSSTEVSTEGAWISMFDHSNNMATTNKNSQIYVRCIRKF